MKKTIIMDRNTSPILPLTQKHMIQALEKTPFNQYPDKELRRFKELYAERNNFNPDLIELANGSDEWLQKFILTFGQNGVMTLDPDFVMYQIYTEQVAVPFYRVPCDENFRFDFDAVCTAIAEKQPSLFLLSNPHNPTGVLFDSADLKRVAAAMAAVGGYLVLDEAYGEFAPAYERPTGEHVIIVRTLSKIYGLAGLRIGIAIAEGETFRQLTRFNHPYPVNALSLNLANELFKDTDHLDKMVAYQLEAKAELVKAFEQIADVITVNPSATNYVFTYGAKAKSLAQFLVDNGFQPRQYQDDVLKNAVRYSIVKLEDYPALNRLIAEWRKKHA